MLIRIKQTRKRAAPGGGFRYGTTISLPQPDGGTRNYQFSPLDAKRPEVDHVCDVTDKADVAKLLANPAGFEIHDSVMPARAPEKPAASTEGALPPAAGGNGAASSYDAMSTAELRAAVAEKTGKKPHASTSKKKLLELLAAG
jgi:hypothetical protein